MPQPTPTSRKFFRSRRLAVVGQASWPVVERHATAHSNITEVPSLAVFSRNPGNRPGRAAGRVLPARRRIDETAGRRVHQADPDDDRADHLLHGRGGDREYRRHEKAGARGPQIAAVLRGADHGGVADRTDGSQDRAAGRGDECQSGHAGRQGRRAVCRAGKGTARGGFSAEHRPRHGDQRLRAGRYSAGAVRGHSIWTGAGRDPPEPRHRRCLRQGGALDVRRGCAHHASRALWRIRRHGVHNWKVRPAHAAAAAQALACVYLTSFAFVFIVLGAIAYAHGFSLWKFLNYIKEELLIVLSTSSSESVLPRMMVKLEELGCGKSVVGLVIPAGYSFNLDGTSIYLTIAALFVAQATNVHPTGGQEAALLVILMLSSKGAAAVTGGGFITLAATLSAIGTVPVAGLTLLLGVDRFMSEMRALTNLVGNGVATIVVAKWEKEFDAERARRVLDGESVPDPAAEIPEPA